MVVVCASASRAAAVARALSGAGHAVETYAGLEQMLLQPLAEDCALVVEASLLPLPAGALPAPLPVLALHPDPPAADPLQSLDDGAHEYVCWRNGRRFPAERVAAARRAAAASPERILATVSHELRAPIGGIMGLCDLLLGTPLDDEQRDHVETARLSGEALLALTEQIVDWARLRSGRCELDPGPFAPRDLVEEVCTLLATQAHAKGLELNCHVPPGGPAEVVTDLARVRQILVNLVTNAVKYTKRGCVDVYGEVEPLPSGASLRLDVYDTGAGIAAADLERLFQPFSQVGEARRARQGVGLGLAISAQLADRLGGSIEVESTLGHGSHFTLRVPVTLPDSTATAPRERPLEGCQILVADADTTARLVSRVYLSEQGARIDDVADGPAALALLAEPEVARGYDLVIFDLLMPGLDGLELATLLRARPELAALPLLALTSLVDPAQHAELEQLGVVRLAKPVREQALLRAVCRLLGRPLPARRSSKPAAGANAGAGAGVRVLIADDDLVTQRVLRLRLTRLGCRVDVMACGKSALAAALRREYDLILLDGHLPGMDGAAIAAELRSRPGPNRAARLATMSASGASRCVHADASFAKPIPLEALIELLPKRPPFGEGRAARPGPGAATEPLPAPGSLAERLGVDLSPAEAAELVERFLADARQRCARARELLARGEWAHVAETGHLIRGACASMGATGLAELAANLETAARRSAAAEALDYLADLERRIAATPETQPP